MTDFDTIMADAKRLLKAIKVFAAAHVDNKHLMNRVHAADIILNRAETDEQLETACNLLRALFEELDARELEYERELPNPPQSLRGTSIRHSPQTRNERGEWRRDVDSVDERAQGVPTQDMETRGANTRNADDTPDIVRSDASRLAGPLSKRKARKTRAKPRRIVPSDNDYSAEIPPKSVEDDT